MRICIYTGNHDTSICMSDQTRLVQRAVMDCGYEVCISPELMPGHCNIVFEHFLEESHLRDLAANKARGARHVMICTELITGATFNGGVVANHWHYNNAPYWKQRFDGFARAAALVDAVWVLSELVIPAYQAALPGKPVRFLPHAHVNGFASVEHRDEERKDIDFFFSGTITDHRRAVLKKLDERYKVVFSPQQTPDYLRLDLLARTKVCLSLRLSPENDLPSLSRMHFHIQNRNFMVHEAYAKASMLDPFVVSAPPDELIEWAECALSMKNRREVAANVLERFKAALPMTRWMQPLLAEATGQEHAEPSAARAA